MGVGWHVPPGLESEFPGHAFTYAAGSVKVVDSETFSKQICSNVKSGRRQVLHGDPLYILVLQPVPN